MLTIEKLALDGLAKFAAFGERLYEEDPFYRHKRVDLSGIPQAEIFMAFDGEEPVARIAAIHDPALHYHGQATGQLGFFESVNDKAVAGVLLDTACGRLRQWNCDWAIGPMNGNIWRSYRLTRRSDRPPFFMDNHHQPYYCELFVAHRFDSIAEYKTTRIEAGRFAFPRLSRFEQQLSRKNITVRSVTRCSFETDLRKIYEICATAFSRNFLYTEIDYPAFKQIYRGIEPLLDQCVVLLAESENGAPLAFVFTVPNLFARGKRSWVIRTLAVVPGRFSQGIGSYLVERVHQAADDNGVDELFHALMHCDNTSTRIGGTAELYHQYTLFGKRL